MFSFFPTLVFRKKTLRDMIALVLVFMQLTTHNCKTFFEIGKTNVLQNSSQKQEEAKVLNVLRYEKM